MPSRRTLSQRAEMFGFDDGSMWALETIRLLFSAPRVFDPLVEAWELRNPGTRSNLARLEALGFAVHQGRVVLDTVAGEEARAASRQVSAYRLTAAGSRLALDASSDIRVLQDLFPRSDPDSLFRLERLLASMHASRQSDLRLFSVRRAAAVSGFSERHARMWLGRLSDERLISLHTSCHRDVREVAPGHWRPSRQLIRQLRDIASDPLMPSAAEALSDLLLERRRELPPIAIAAAEYSGSSDFDHDIRSQQIAAKLLSDPRRVPPKSIFRMEPPLRLSAVRVQEGLQFVPAASADATSYYRPDAEFREATGGRLSRSVLEYERRQSRTDAWTHIESFAGMMHLRAMPFETGNLRFVVESRRRADSYWKLCRSYSERMHRMPDSSPRCSISLFVAVADDVLSAKDPFSESVWRSVSFDGTGKGPILLHDRELLPGLQGA